MIIFRNSGVIDIRAVTTFGVSSKENAGAIGFFGTGLKYALAILLREGCDITIYAGTEPKRFGLRAEKIRVTEFQTVTMGGRRLAFTTELGKTWQLWQAFRELYCNCLDESGEVFRSSEDPGPLAGHTTIVVRGEKFEDVWDTRHDVILNTKPLATADTVEIHPGPSKFLFYRGVRAYELHHPSLFTYNVTRKLDLTEDRTIKWLFEANQAIARGITEIDRAEVIRTVVLSDDRYAEHGLDFSGNLPGETFLKEVGDHAKRFDPRLNKTATKACALWMKDALPSSSASLEALEAARLRRAVAFCRQIGYPVDEYPIIVTEFLGDDVLGRAHDDKIYVSRRVFMSGTKMLAGTLVEEFLHLRHGLHDTTRSMQNFLMDAIVSLGERLVGEPL